MKPFNHQPRNHTTTLPATTVVLFDIDGTLLSLHGAGRRAFSRALERVFGWKDDIEYVNFAGATDWLVLQQIMERRGHGGTERDRRRFFKQLPRELAQTVIGATCSVHPGVPELLSEMAMRRHCRLGLVTGNIRACAYIKLKEASLDHYFRFGGFGDDHHDRREIARVAVSRATRSRAHSRFFLVGDSPSDIAAAQAIGATSLGVATGSFKEEDLRRAGADRVLSDLSDTSTVLRLLA